MPERIVYLTNLRMPTEKAYGVQIAKMCEAFSGYGADLELVIPNRPNLSGKTIFEYYSIKNNFRVRKISTPDFYLPGELDKLAFVTKNFISSLALFYWAISSGADFIYSRDEFPLFLLSFFKKNLIFEAHKFSSGRLRFYNQFKRAGIRIVAISEGLKEEFVKFGFDSSKILVAHDGVDLDEFSIAEGREECRKKFRLPLDKKIVGYVGQLRTMGMEKGINVLIKAMAELKKSQPIAVLAIMGGIFEDIEYYKNIAKQEGVEDSVIFMGRKDHSEVPYFLKACDVLAMPFPNIPHYAKYMSPLKMFEYMASGKPIVATDLPTVREILNEDNALLVEPDNSHALAGGLSAILTNTDSANDISRQALEDIKNYTWSKRVLNILEFVK